MDRRKFLAASMASSALAVAGKSAAESPASGAREYYQLRRYSLLSGPQTKLTESFFADALIPALSRLGLGPVGAFRLEIGPDTPATYLLIPGPSIDVLAWLRMPHSSKPPTRSGIQPPPLPHFSAWISPC